jgi:hypothetical protein
MDVTDTKTVYEIKKKDGKVAMRVTVEYFDLDYQQMVATTGVHLQTLEALTEMGKQEAEVRKSKPA